MRLFFPLFCRFQTARDLCKKVLPPTAENLCLDLGCWEGEEFYKGLDVLGNHGLSGLLEESPYEKSPKCLGGDLGEFGGFCKGLNLLIIDLFSSFL